MIKIHGFALLVMHSVKHSHVKNYKFLLLVLNNCSYVWYWACCFGSV